MEHGLNCSKNLNDRDLKFEEIRGKRRANLNFHQLVEIAISTVDIHPGGLRTRIVDHYCQL